MLAASRPPPISEMPEDALVLFLERLSMSPAIPLSIDGSAKTVCINSRMNSGMEFLVTQAINRLERFFGFNGYSDLTRVPPRPCDPTDKVLGQSFWGIRALARGYELAMRQDVIELYAPETERLRSQHVRQGLELLLAMRGAPAILASAWAKLGIEGTAAEHLAALMTATMRCSEPFAVAVGALEVAAVVGLVPTHVPTHVAEGALVMPPATA